MFLHLFWMREELRIPDHLINYFKINFKQNIHRIPTTAHRFYLNCLWRWGCTHFLFHFFFLFFIFIFFDMLLLENAGISCMYDMMHLYCMGGNQYQKDREIHLIAWWERHRYLFNFFFIRFIRIAIKINLHAVNRFC